MLLTYVNESFTDDWFTMAALLLDGSASAALTVQLDQVAADAARAYGLPAGPESNCMGMNLPRSGAVAGGAEGGTP